MTKNSKNLSTKDWCPYLNIHFGIEIWALRVCIYMLGVPDFNPAECINTVYLSNLSRDIKVISSPWDQESRVAEKER